MTSNLCFSQLIKIYDYENKNSIPGVTLYLFKNSNSLNSNQLIDTKITDNDGTVFIKSKENYKLKIDHISYKTFDTLINFLSDTVDIKLIKKNNPLDEVVVTGQIGSDRVKNSLNNIFLISRDEINKNSSKNLNELLSSQALFDIQVDPALGSSISIQGISGNNVNILVDGIPVIGRKGSQIDLSQISLSNVDRIEVFKGPAAVSYGTNSTGGVINLITIGNDDDLIDLNFYLESIGVSQLDFQIKKSYESQQFKFNIGSYDFTGHGVDSLRSKEWNPKKQKFSELYWSKNIGQNKIQFKSSIFNEELIDMGNENFPPFNGTALDIYYLTNRNSNYLKFNKFSDKFDFNSLFSYSTTKFKKSQFNIDLNNNSQTQTLDPQFNNQDFFKTFYSRLEFNRFFSSNNKLQLGFDSNFEKIRGAKIQNNYAEIKELSFFTQGKVKLINNITSLIGLRLPYHSIYSAPIIPSFSLKYDFSPSFIFRSSFSRGFRAPTIKELFMEFIDINHNIVGNTDLQAEKSNSFQSSITFTPKKNINNFLSFNFEYFLNDLTNKISLAEIENTGVYTYYNSLNTKYKGIVFKLESNLNSENKINFIWNRYLIENELLQYAIPKQNFNVSYAYFDKKYSFGFNLNWKMKSKTEFERFNELDELVLYTQEPYNLLNVNFQKKFKNTILIKLGFKNLLDVKKINSEIQDAVHSGSQSLISWGRTSYLSIIYSPF